MAVPSLTLTQTHTRMACGRRQQSIKAELDLETRYAQRRTVSNSTLNRLNDQVDMYTSKVEIERKNEKTLRNAVKQMTKKILSKVRGRACTVGVGMGVVAWHAVMSQACTRRVAGRQACECAAVV